MKDTLLIASKIIDPAMYDKNDRLRIPKRRYGALEKNVIPKIQGSRTRTCGISVIPALNDIRIQIGREISHKTIFRKEGFGELKSSRALFLLVMGFCFAKFSCNFLKNISSEMRLIALVFDSPSLGFPNPDSIILMASFLDSSRIKILGSGAIVRFLPM